VPYAAQAKAALLAYPAKTAQLIRVTQIPTGPDPAQSVIDVLWYNIVATNDAILKLGGNPFDNHFRWYFGSNGDLLLNLKVQRFKADDAALRAIAAGYQTTGRFQVPLVTLHTTGDNVVPFGHELIYATKITLHGSLSNFVGLPVARCGHCSFTPAEAVTGLAVMLLKAH
jgi:hypothetical protein